MTERVGGGGNELELIVRKGANSMPARSMNRPLRTLIVVAALAAFGILASVAFASGAKHTAKITAAQVKGGVKVHSQPGDKPLHLAFFGLCACNPYTAGQARGVQKAVKALGNGSTYTFFDGKFLAQPQVNQIQDAVTSGKYNAFVILPNDSAAVVPVVKQAIAKGIKVGALTFPVGPSYTITDRAQVPGVVMSLVNNPVTDGLVTATRTNELCAGKNPCNVVVMMGVRTISWELQRYNAVKKTFTKNIHIVNVCDGKFLQDGGFKCMQDSLQITKDIDVVMTPSGDEMLTGAQKALAAQGIKIGNQNSDGKFKFTGLGASTDSVDQVKKGLWDSTRVFLGDPTIDTIVVQALSDHVNGRGAQWPTAFSTDLVSPIGPEVTPETLKKVPSFKGEWCC